MFTTDAPKSHQTHDVYELHMCMQSQLPIISNQSCKGIGGLILHGFLQDGNAHQPHSAICISAITFFHNPYPDGTLHCYLDLQRTTMAWSTLY